MRIGLKMCSRAMLAVTVSAAFVLGAGAISQAAPKKKKEEAKPAEKQALCWGGTPVCATKGGEKFTYSSACFAANDGATVVSDNACPEKMTATAKHAKKKTAKKQ